MEGIYTMFHLLASSFFLLNFDTELDGNNVGRVERLELQPIYKRGS